MSRLKKLSVSFDITVPENASFNEIQEWIEYCLGYKSSIDLKNPLEAYGLSSGNVEFLNITEYL